MPRPSTGSKKNGFKAALDISPELKEFLGREKVSRPQLTKLMWAYFKSQKLMDPSDKRFVVSDDKLKKLTGEDRFQAFSFMKLLNKHIVKPNGDKAEEEAAEPEDAAVEEEAEEAPAEEAPPKAEAAAAEPAKEAEEAAPKAEEAEPKAEEAEPKAEEAAAPAAEEPKAEEAAPAPAPEAAA